jgi:hypothetical protein
LKNIVTYLSNTKKRIVHTDPTFGFEHAYKALKTFRLELRDALPDEGVSPGWMFPYLWGAYDTERNLVLGYDRSSLSMRYFNSFEVDLLTRKRKDRSFLSVGAFFAFTESGLNFSTVKKMMRDNSIGFCKSCHEIARMVCSRCKERYHCGRDECTSVAWEAHRHSCVTFVDVSAKTKGKGKNKKKKKRTGRGRA